MLPPFQTCINFHPQSLIKHPLTQTRDQGPSKRSLQAFRSEGLRSPTTCLDEQEFMWLSDPKWQYMTWCSPSRIIKNPQTKWEKNGVWQTSIDMNYEHTKQPLRMIKSTAGHCQQKNWGNNSDWHTIWIAFWQNLGSDSSFQKCLAPGGLALWPKPTTSSRAFREDGLTDGFNQSFSRVIFHFKKNSSRLPHVTPWKRNTKNSQQYNSTTHFWIIYDLVLTLTSTSEFRKNHPIHNFKVGTRVHRSPLGAEAHVQGRGP